MRTGLAFITVGVLCALIGRNTDAYVMAGMAVMSGLAMLRVRGLS
jgi:branched-subunit amino acid transport protein